MNIIGLFIYLLIIIGAGLGLAYLYRKYITRRQEVETEKKEYSLISISVPKENEKTPEAAESMFATLHGIYQTQEELAPGAQQEQISFEIAARGEEIRFFCYLPTYLKDFVEGQIYAQYPEVEIREVQDYAEDTYNQIFTKNGELDPKAGKSVSSSELVLTKEEFFPLKTFENFDVDPLASITGVLGKIKPDEDVWIQIIVRPESDEWQQKGIAYVDAIKAGKTPGKSWVAIIFSALTGLMKDLAQTAMNPNQEGGGAEEEVELPGPVSAALESAEEKITKLGFSTKIRLAAIGPDKIQARNRLQSVIGAFKQYNTQNMNGFVSSPVKLDDADEVNAYTKRFFTDKGYILNIGELASLFHLPNISVKTPNMIWAGSRKGEPPANLPLLSSHKDSKNMTPFAETDFRGKVEKFGIWQDDLRRHMYLIGKTGTGKTTCLQNMAIDKIQKGHGVGIIDPHGDFIETVLNFIPDERIKDVVIVDPSDAQFPVAFNPVEQVDESLKNVVCSGLVGIFKKIWAESWGPRLEHILRNTIFALLEYEGATLLGIPKMLVDQNYRDKVVENIDDPVVKDFWVTEFGQYDQKFRTEAIAPIQNKVGQFLSSSSVRNILGQEKSTIDFEDIMDHKKILLMDLSKGKIGEDASALLGAMLITKIQLTAMRRTYQPEEERVDFTLFVDEFQNFATESFATILSEARKYRLSLIMANQYIAQMDEVVRESIFGNVGSLISFRVGPSDAPYLATEFMPTFEETDLINLDKFQIYNKMAIEGVTSAPFSAKTLPPFTKKTNNAQKARQYTRDNYAKPIEDVEKIIDDTDQEGSKSIVEEKEEKLNLDNKTYEGKTYEAKVGTDSRVWYIGEGTKQIKPTKTIKPEQGTETKKQATTNSLKEHLKRLRQDNKLPGDDNKEQATDKPAQTKAKDENGNTTIKEGEKINLNGK